jgi:uncharacterized protein (TIGR02246 family)
METRGDRAIEQLFRDWADAVRRGDARALADLMTEDAEFWSHGAAPLRGREETVTRMASFFQSYALDQVFERTEIAVSGDLAFVRGMEVNRLAPRDGGEPLEVRQRAFSILFRGADGAWRFARGMTNRPPDE